MASKPKPVIGICATCGARFKTQAEMTRHEHRRIELVFTTKEHDVTRTEAVAKAETLLALSQQALEENVNPVEATAYTEIAKAFLTLARLADS